MAYLRKLATRKDVEDSVGVKTGASFGTISGKAARVEDVGEVTDTDSSRKAQATLP